MYKVKKYLTAGFFFAAAAGTLAHFFYEWSGGNTLVALFAPVSESTWEHMKLLFFPVLIWSLLIPGRLAEENPGLRSAVILGGILGTLSIPVLFYTYSGILGRTVTWVDIALFYISTAAAFIFAFRNYGQPLTQKKRTAICIMTVLFSAAFFLFTFFPPDIGLFRTPDALP